MCNFLQWRLVLWDTALSLFYALLRNWVSIILLSETALKNLANLQWNTPGCTWLARNSKDRTPAANCKLNDPSKETCNSPSSLCSLKQTIKPVSNAKLIPPVGFISKGNTCYANSILQVLSVVPNLWDRVPSKSNILSPLVQAISLNMDVKKNSTKAVDPPNFLWALKRKLSIIRGVPLHPARCGGNTTSCSR